MTPAADDRLVALLVDALTGIETEDPALSAEVEVIRTRLTDPLRVVLAGRVSCGKSTLLNALLGQTVAPTDVSECTRVVTWYRHGFPERVRLLLADGTTHDVHFAADGRLPKELGVPHTQIQAVEVTLANETLRTLTLVDTPGFSSGEAAVGEAEHAEHEVMDQRSREAAASCDAMVFVLNQNLKADELEVLRAFQRSQGTPASAVNAFGALTKVDRLSSPGEDPLEVGVRLAKRYAERHSGEVAGVVAVCGLLAQTAEAALLTERDVDNLVRLQTGTASESLGLMLLSEERFLGEGSPISVADRRRLLELLDLYGLERVLAIVQDGARTAGDVRRELSGASGIERLRSQLFESFAGRGALLRLLWAVDAIWSLSYRRGVGEPDAKKLRDVVESVRLDPAMHQVKEMQALEKLISGEARLPPELEAEVRLFALNREPVLAMQAEASADVREAVQAGVARWRSFRLHAGPAEDEIARVMLRSYQLAARR